MLILNNLAISLETGITKVSCHDQEDYSTRLGKNELSLLKVFLTKQHQILTKEELIKVVWENKPVTDGVLTNAICKLRNVLRVAALEDCIISIKGVGYISELDEGLSSKVVGL